MKTELRHAGLIRAVAAALEESDGIDVTLPYDVTVRMVESIEELAKYTQREVDEKVKGLQDKTAEQETKFAKLETKVNESVGAFEKRINDAGVRAFTDAKKLNDAVRAHVERMNATEQIVLQLKDEIEKLKEEKAGKKTKG